jgi:hypothetical protein
MAGQSERLTLYDPATYQICVQGKIALTWSRDFTAMALSYLDPDGLAPRTILEGRVLDQAQLIGLITQLYGLGLPLVSVQFIAPALSGSTAMIAPPPPAAQ